MIASRRLLAVVPLLLAACISPTEPRTIVPVTPSLTAFALEAARNPALSADVVASISGDTVRLAIPEVVALDSLVPSWITNEAVTLVTLGDSFPVNGLSRVSLAQDRRIRLTSSTGTEREYVLTVTVFTGLPVVRINTDGGAEVATKTTYVGATIDVYGGRDHPEWSFNMRTQIRGRGNSTWYNPKKPYRLKLATSRSVLGFPAERDWVLLANYWDLSLARNATAFRISSLLGMAFTPRCTPAEFYLNDVHQGSYQLCDHMEVGAARIPAGADGWFLELNDIRRVDPDEVWFATPEMTEYTTVGHGDTIPSVWVYKSPDAPSPAQRSAIEGQLLAFEQALYGPHFTDPDSGYAAHLDAQSLVDWWLVMELSKNNDAAFSFGVYMYRTATGRITFGPVWDFDLAFGNYPYDGGPTGFKILVAGYLPRLMEDPAFVALVKQRWQVLYAHRAELDAFIGTYTASLQRSQQLTHALWAPYNPRPLLIAGPDEQAWFTPSVDLRAAFTDADYGTAVQEMRSWLSARFDWLQTNILAL